jgi:hypothetical protein
VISPFATINIKLHVPMTLDLKPSNFTKWSTAFQAMCGKFGLLHHLATASTPRPTDEVWTQADFCVRSWMYSTVSDAVLNLAMTDNTQTASALWTAIGGVFQANKAPRAIFLNHEFHSPTQGDLSIDAYCVRMKEKADELRDVGQPVYESNLVLNLLRGLIEAYSGVTDNIAGQQPLTLATARHQQLLRSCGCKTMRRRVLPPPSWLLPPRSSSSRVAGTLTPKRAPSSPSSTAPHQHTRSLGLQSLDRRTCGPWRACHPSWTAPPGRFWRP